MRPKIIYVLTTRNDELNCIPVVEELKGKTDTLVIVDENGNIPLPSDLPAKVKQLGSYNSANIHHILHQEAPQLLALASDSALISRAFILCASRLGITTIFIGAGIHSPTFRKRREILRTLHSIAFSKQPFRDARLIFNSGLVLDFIKIALYTLKHRYYGGHGGCSLSCVRGKVDKDLLIQQGVKSSSIIVTGDPHLDAIYKLKTQDKRKDVTNKLNIQAHSKIILLLIQDWVEVHLWSANQRQVFLSGVLNVMRNLANCTPVLKLHPHQSLKAYQGLLQQLSLDDILIVQNEVPLHDLLATCDVAIGVYSTTLFEAMVFDKPVIVVNLFKEPDYMGYIASGAAICVERDEDLAPAIHSALYDEQVRGTLDENRKKFLYEHTYIQDGQATKRVADLIIQMIEESRKAKVEA